MGCGGPLSRSGAGCRPDVLGRRGDTSELAVQAPSLQRRLVSSLLEGRHLKNWTFTWGAGPCGDPGLQALL